MYRITIMYTDRTEVSEVWHSIVEGIEKLRDPDKTVASIVVLKLLVPDPNQLPLFK